MKPNKKLRRPAPAFDCYASDLMASEAFELASLAERGLLLTMWNYLWVNETLPADPAVLAQRLHLSPGLLAANYGTLIKAHILAVPAAPERLYSPELQRQRENTANYRAKKAEAGRKGGEATQARAKAASTRTASSSAPSSASSSALAPEKKRKETKRQSPTGDDQDHSAWLADYDSP